MSREREREQNKLPPSPQEPAPMDGAKIFWKSLADKADPETAKHRAQAEFPEGVAPERAGNLVSLRRSKGAEDVAVGRRGFMFFAGASAALFAEGCARRPVEKILPYSKAPEQLLPGVPTSFASVRQQRGDAIGVVVESHEGHPTKVEGNPDHPSSLGGTDVWTQASVYDLYDPDRSTTPMKGARSGAGFGSHQPAQWSEVDTMLAEIARTAGGDGGAKLRLLVEPTTSPTFIRLRDALQAKFPNAKIHVWSAMSEGSAREGAKIAFGQAVTVVPSYAAARVVLSLDSDLLGTEPGAVRANKELSVGRKLSAGPRSDMSRLYVVEPTFTITGMNADHRLRLPAQDVERYLLLLAKELVDKHGVDLGAIKDAAKADAAGISEKWIKVVAKELAGARAKSVLVAGTRQPARVHALVHALNAALGNVGHTVRYYPVADVLEPDPASSLKQLATDIEKGAVGALVILGGNPVYDAPGDVRFGDKLKTIGSSVHVSSHVDETSEGCAWHVPRAHELEAWGDLRALDGTVAIQQPLIAPLHGGRSDVEILAKLAGEASPKGHDLVRATTKAALGPSASPFSRVWNEALKRGMLGAPARAFGPMEARKTEIAAALSSAKPRGAVSASNLEVSFAPCPKLLDGRHANNPLLLELPDPLTKICWDNVALVSQATAAALGVQSGDVVRLTRDGALPVDVAAWVAPGQADHSIGLLLGWGRQKAGRYGSKHGFDVNALRTTDALWMAPGVKVQKLTPGELEAIRGRHRRVGLAARDSEMPARVRPDDPFEVETWRYKISQTQEHDTMEGRPVAIDATLEEYRKNAFFPQYPNEERREKDEHGKPIGVRQAGSPEPTTPPLWGDWKEPTFRDNYRWGLAIDMTACTGCNACVVACSVENNVPTVGKEQIWRGREMYWLRIDRYFVGMDASDPQVVFQPVACVQCEEAPCENVCPVNATAHSPDGLNDMAYNRCIGTRYCANNCPYKVRRFNFFNYHTSGGAYDDVPETEKMQYNPNVTVRMRGVMEKCTYCVQRIQEAKIRSKRTGKPLKDGDVVSACQQACPANAIVFGDLNDPSSKVSRWRAADRSYRLLAELGTRPRTTYLGKIRNPNAEMKEGS